MGSEGLFEWIKKHPATEYNPGALNIDDLHKLLSYQDAKPYKERQFSILCDAYGVAVLNNDKDAIAYWERQHRKDYVLKWRRMVAKYGIGMAKVLDWLGAYKNGFTENHYHSTPHWTATHLGLVWGEYGHRNDECDESYVSMVVKLNPDLTFQISIRGEEGYGYDTPKTKVLSERASYSSLLNQIAYFKRKYSPHP
jgi:hypothetical protein